MATTLSKRVWPLRAKDLLLVGGLWYTMRQREFQALRDELLDVWTSDLVRRCEFLEFENLSVIGLAGTPIIPPG
jgi:hypothetical protein